MSDSAQKSVLLELVSKNYTGDSEGYEKALGEASESIPSSDPIPTPTITHAE